MDHTDVALLSAVRALKDVVAPAVDPDNSQANEQLRLAIDYVEFVVSRLDFLHDRELFDLRHHLDMARAVHAVVGPLGLPESKALEAAIESGEATHAKPGARMRGLKDATASLAAAIATIVREAPRLDTTVQRRVEQSVVHASHARIAFERAWYLPLGFDPDKGDIGNLEEILEAAAQERSRAPRQD